MGKYSPLGIYLRNSKKENEILTFYEIEAILGFSLPHSAKIRRAWWGNENNKNTRHTHCREWMQSGWKVESVNLGINVRFKKNN
jgi:hypothetical protein